VDWTAVLTPSLGATGLLAGVVIMILTGRLVPRRQLDDLRSDKDAQIETWKTAYERAMEGQDVQRGHIVALLEANRTATHVIQALPQAAHRNERSPQDALEEG
jgi:DNA/RNA endonuclease G (NUC1)